MPEREHTIDNAMAAVGALARELQRRYGDDALTLFEPIMREYGLHSGTRLRKKLGDIPFPERIVAWLEQSIKEGLCEIIAKNSSSVTLKSYYCPLGLDKGGRTLCDRLMSFDKGFITGLAGQDAHVTVYSTRAQGDSCCHVKFSLEP
jgi:predicted hydrocarbon binding protein